MRASRWTWVPVVVLAVAAGMGGCKSSSDKAGGGAGDAKAGDAAAQEQQHEQLAPDVTVDTQKIDVPHSTIDTTEEVDPTMPGR